MRLRRSRLSEEQTELLLRSFVAGTAARRAAESARVNRHTATLCFHRLRELIARHLPPAGPAGGQLEVDPADLHGAYADPHLVPLFGLIERGGRVQTVMLPARPPPASSRRRDGERLDAIVCRGPGARRAALRLVRLREADAAGENDNFVAIRAFWCCAQKHLRRFRGIPRQHLELFVKECEWRFTYRTDHRLLQTLRLWLQADRLARRR